MTPRMISALADAAEAASGVGLVRGGSYFRNERKILAPTHRVSTITELVDRGYMRLYNRGQIAHATEAGLAALAIHRDEVNEGLTGRVRA